MNISNEERAREVRELKRVIKETKSGNLPLHSEIKRNSKSLKYIRQDYINTISDTIVTQNLVRYLVDVLKGKKCLEVFAGLGFLSRQLQDRGVDITPIDTNERFPKVSTHYTSIKQYDDILYGIKKNNDVDFVLYQYPGYKNNTARKMLRHLRRQNPNVVIIIIGEKGGLTANKEFFFAVEEITNNKSYNMVNANYMKWNNRVDCVTFYKPLLSKEEQLFIERNK